MFNFDEARKHLVDALEEIKGNTHIKIEQILPVWDYAKT